MLFKSAASIKSAVDPKRQCNCGEEECGKTLDARPFATRIQMRELITDN